MLGREGWTRGREVGVMGRDERKNEMRGRGSGFSSSCLGEDLPPQGAL